VPSFQAARLDPAAEKDLPSYREMGSGLKAKQQGSKPFVLPKNLKIKQQELLQ